MPNQVALEAFLRERVTSAVAPLDHFVVGTVEDDCYCLVKQADDWVVGTGERGKLYPIARFDWPVNAAKYLIFCLLDRPGGFTYPAVDWTGYASLPD